MVRISVDRALAVFGIILTLLLVVLDKAGKLKGPMLFGPLAIAAAMTLPLVVAIPWVANKSGVELYARRGLMVCIVGVAYFLLAVWISRDMDHPHEETTEQVINHSGNPRADVSQQAPAETRHSSTPLKVPRHSGDHRHVGSPTGLPTQQTISAPNGIAIGGGTVVNPTVNNYGTPQRQLMKDQRESLISYLRPFCPFEVVIRAIPGDSESQEYASQIASAIKEAGCTLGRTPFLIDNAASYGIQIAIHDVNDIPHGADALAGAFKAAGILFESVTGEPVKPKAIYIMVNFNPSKRP